METETHYKTQTETQSDQLRTVWGLKTVQTFQDKLATHEGHTLKQFGPQTFIST